MAPKKKWHALIKVKAPRKKDKGKERSHVDASTGCSSRILKEGDDLDRFSTNPLYINQMKWEELSFHAEPKGIYDILCLLSEKEIGGEKHPFAKYLGSSQRTTH